MYMMNVVFRVLVSIFLLYPLIGWSEGVPRHGVFVTVIQTPQVLASRQAILDLVAYAKQTGTDTLLVQVYRADQAWFLSKVGDSEPYIASLKSVGEDPFALLIEKAHAESIKVHAWVNLLSLSANSRAPLLKKYGASILTRSKKKKLVLDDYKIDGQFFLEPGDPRVRSELTIMVEELVRAYPDMDGIQFDYIRYPDEKPHYGYSRMNVDRFKQAHKTDTIIDSSQVWKDWKRAQVTALLRALIGRVKELRPNLVISTTGCSPYTRAFEEAFQDWPLWVNSGLVDFVTVMTYSPDPVEFRKLVQDARSKVSDVSKINFAVGAYQQVNSPERFIEQFQFCQDDGRGSCIIFHYGSIISSPVMREFLNK